MSAMRGPCQQPRAHYRIHLHTVLSRCAQVFKSHKAHAYLTRACTSLFNGTPRTQDAAKLTPIAITAFSYLMRLIVQSAALQYDLGNNGSGGNSSAVEDFKNRLRDMFTVRCTE
jgi:hypothetical protein